ncbi:MAG: 16S rRNA (guanine(527)-N(7))-methyltransferase RsmG [Proteobacteria bacterium]|nr:16S rRNA (guanine(527)-N(7))-methyltransferase RsmG [Pseudomonadota bacterium]
MPLTPQQFAKMFNVSRETIERFEIYAELLLKWQNSVGLVGRSTLADLWRRHMLDSAQIVQHALPLSRSWLDIGSGAGFPGIVVAIMGGEDVHLVEANTRKCEFLREVCRQTGISAIIHQSRMENLDPWPVDVITSRACASVRRLVELSYPFMSSSTTCLFLKGQDVEGELTEATKYWNMSVKRTPSVSDSRGTVLRLTEVSHV